MRSRWLPALILATLANWTVDPQAPPPHWAHNPNLLEDVPYQAIFRIGSTQTTYRLGVATMTFSFVWHSWAAPVDGGSAVALICQP